MGSKLLTSWSCSVFSVAGPVPRSQNNEVEQGIRKSPALPMPLGPAILQRQTVAALGRWAWTTVSSLLHAVWSQSQALFRSEMSICCYHRVQGRNGCPVFSRPVGHNFPLSIPTFPPEATPIIFLLATTMDPSPSSFKQRGLR